MTSVDVQQFEDLMLYPAVPLTTKRLANVQRAHLLVEPTARSSLQCFLAALQPMLLDSRTPL